MPKPSADCIKAHVLLCWLGMLLIRIAEDKTNLTWFQMKKTLSTLQAGLLRTEGGAVCQSGMVRPELDDLLNQLGMKPPPKFLDFPIPPEAKL